MKFRLFALLAAISLLLLSPGHALSQNDDEKKPESAPPEQAAPSPTAAPIKEPAVKKHVSTKKQPVKKTKPAAKAPAPKNPAPVKKPKPSPTPSPEPKLGTGNTSPLSEFELGRYQYCGKDTDCTVSINGCCDCANGGIEVGVNKERLEDFRQRFDCLYFECGRKLANPPCANGVVSCVNHKCKYFDDVRR